MRDYGNNGTSTNLLGNFVAGSITNLSYTSDGLYFTADNGITGPQPWKTDGNPTTSSVPVAANQSISIQENIAQAIELTAADTNPNDTLTYAIA